MFDLTPDEWVAIRLSLRIALVATFVALPFGLAIAWLLARKNFWGKALLDGIVHLPLVLPPVVTGYLLLITFGRKGAVGGFLYDLGIVFSFRWTGAALACGIMGFPLLVRAIRLSFEVIDRRLEDAASTLGANRAWVFLTVTLPLALPGVIAVSQTSASGVSSQDPRRLGATDSRPVLISTLANGCRGASASTALRTASECALVGLRNSAARRESCMFSSATGARSSL